MWKTHIPNKNTYDPPLWDTLMHVEVHTRQHLLRHYPRQSRLEMISIYILNWQLLDLNVYFPLFLGHQVKFLPCVWIPSIQMKAGWAWTAAYKPSAQDTETGYIRS